MLFSLVFGAAANGVECLWRQARPLKTEVVAKSLVRYKKGQNAVLVSLVFGAAANGVAVP